MQTGTIIAATVITGKDARFQVEPGPVCFPDALDPSPSLFCLWAFQKKVTGKGEKQNRKKISQSRNRNIPLGNHHGNREVTSPEESGMKQPNTLRT